MTISEREKTLYQLILKSTSDKELARGICISLRDDELDEMIDYMKKGEHSRKDINKYSVEISMNRLIKQNS